MRNLGQVIEVWGCDVANELKFIEQAINKAE